MSESNQRQKRYAENLAKLNFSDVLGNEANFNTKRECAIDAGYTSETANNVVTIEKGIGFQSWYQKIVSDIRDSNQDTIKRVLKDSLNAVKPYGKHAELHPDYSERSKTAFKILEIAGGADGSSIQDTETGSKDGNRYITFLQQNVYNSIENDKGPDTPETAQ